MGLFVIGVIFVACAFFSGIILHLAGLTQRKQSSGIMGKVVSALFALAGIALITWSSAVYVESDMRGLLTKKIFADDLSGGRIIALENEKGPQAKLLPPGWHFGYWPFIYDIQLVKIVTVPAGSVGVVKANDGLPLLKGQAFADEWDSPMDMLDAVQFLNKGKKGPQLTVLSPGSYPVHPLLFSVEIKKALEVEVGQVAVIKANAGPDYTGEDLVSVNGVPIVPNSFRGIWKDALQPDMYYINPDAYNITRVATVNRVYNYVEGNAIEVRSKDGFEFPVDVRVSVKVSAQDAPYVVAQLAKPDSDIDRTGFTTIEDRVILPVIRAIFRNTAESQRALEYVNNRSVIEKEATKKFGEGIKRFHITTDGVFVNDIGLSKNPAGQELLATQTQREVAEQEKATWAKKQEAQVARAEAVRAEEEANQERQKAAARASIDINKSEALALMERARGEARAYEEKIKALGGTDNFIMLEVVKDSVNRWDGVAPSVLVMGDGGVGDGASAGVLREIIKRDK